MEKKILIDNKAVPVSDTKTVISLNKPTPSWVNWIFRIQFVLNKAVTYYITAADGWNAAELKKSMLILGTIDFVIWGLGRFIGQDKADYEAKR